MAIILGVDQLSTTALEKILEACDQYLAKELGLEVPEYYITQTPIFIPEVGYKWQNTTEFQNYVETITQQPDIRKAYATLYTKWEEKTKAEGGKKVEKTTLSEKELKPLEEEAEKRKVEEEKAKIAAQVKTKEFIKAQEKLYLNLPKKTYIPEITPEDETKIKELIEVKVKPNPTYYADSLAKEIVKQNKTPQMSRDEVNILKANAKLVAIGYTNNLLSLDSKEETIGGVAKLVWAKNPIHIAASLTNPNNPLVGENIARAAQITALTLEHDNLIARNLLSKVVDPKILPLFYPGSNELIIYEVSDKENKETVISVDKKAFTDQGIKLEESNNQIFSLVKENLWGEIKNRSWGFLDKTLENTPWYSKVKSLLPDFLKPKIPIFAGGEAMQPGLSLLWSRQGIQLLSTDMPTLLSSSFGKNIFLTPSFGLQFGKFITTEGVSGQFFGINFGGFGVKIVHLGEENVLFFAQQLRLIEGVPRVAAAGEAVITAGKIGATAVATAGKTAAGVAAKTGLTASLATTLAFLGSWATPVASAIIFVATWLAGKIIEPILLWAKKHQEDLKIVGLLMLGGGIIIRSLPLMVTGGLIFVPIALRSGLSMAGIAARTTFLFGRIGASMAITIGTPIIVAIIVFPILVAIILFIINSGAYLVPPTTGGANVINPYIKVEKIIQESNTNLITYKNNDLPQTVHYTVSIIALKGTLQNVKITYKCSVSKKGSAVSCPEPDPEIPTATIVELSPTSPYTFSYSHTFTSPDFIDSLIVDTITVNAFVPVDSLSTQTSGVASVVIGTPPTECPSIWPISGSGYVSQGSFAPGCTHSSMEALDVAGGAMTVVATHGGIVKNAGWDDCYGNYVDLESVCNNTPFASRYAHLESISASINPGQPVALGTTLGISGNTGSCSHGAHLHYDFRGKTYPNNPPYMMKPYLPVDIIRGCCSDNGNPCNQSVP